MPDNNANVKNDISSQNSINETSSNLSMDETKDNNINPTSENVPEKPIVKKVELDDSNFEYNHDIANKSNDDLDINLSDSFDDRLGSSNNDTSNDSVI